MDWFFFAALGILWAAFLLPTGGRRASPATSVQEFERKMDLLEQTEQRSPGRWLLAPRKGEPFVGVRERHRLRARERRRRVFVFLLEAIGLTFLMGLFPPLRRMWYLTGGLVGVLVLYCWLLLHYKRVEAEERSGARARPAPRPLRPSTPPSVWALPGPAPRPARREANGHRPPWLLGEGDKVHVIIRLPEELEAANA